jgi:hypothetical protein
MTTYLRILLTLLVLATVPTTAHADMWCLATFFDNAKIAVEGQSACFPLTDAQLLNGDTPALHLRQHKPLG